MSDMPWSKFFWSDWESDQGLRLCSLAAQGLWMRMLCVCARHDPKGYLSINGNPLKVDAIARLAGVAETEAETLVAELELNGVFSRNRSGCIYSRRMVRDAISDKARAEIYGTPRPAGSKPHRTLNGRRKAAILREYGAVCAYCGDTIGPFEIDHIHPISRGGTDDKENLAVSCKSCNRSKGVLTLEEWGFGNV